MNSENKIKEIKRIIEEDINPTLQQHMGGAVLSAFEDGIAWIKFTGSCRGCYAADDTMDKVVRPALMGKIKGLKDVCLDTSVDEDLLDFARQILSKNKDVK